MAFSRRRLLALGGLLAAALAPLSVRPQAARLPHVALLLPRPVPWLEEPLRLALHRRGWVSARNFVLDVRTASDELPGTALAERLVQEGADLIVVAGTHMALAAQRATRRVPIVMYLSGFPVEGGLVESFARPGGNITGLATYSGEAFFTKHVSLMRELVPALRTFGVLWDYLPPAFLEKEAQFGMHALELAAAEMKVAARIRTAASEEDIARALADFDKAHIDVLFATSGPANGFPGAGAGRIISFTHRRKLPLVCDIAGSLFRAGGVLSYSAS